MHPVRPTSENSVAMPLRWLSDQLRINQIDDVVWRVTRDMRADPMTKGNIRRDLAKSIMDDKFIYDFNTIKNSKAKHNKN
eukprot:6475107-Pyramimonas_sp.AAC.1